MVSVESVARFAPTSIRRVIKRMVRRLPPNKFVLRMLPPRMAFERVYPLIDRVPGLLVSPYQEQWLFETARSLPNRATILEVGGYKGRSTACLGFACAATRKHVFVVDTFNGNDVDFFERGFYEEFCQNLEICQLTSYVTPLIGCSWELAKGWNKPIHFLFLDGSHRFEDVLADFHGFFPHVVAGGIVALHDVVDEWPGPSKAWHGYIKERLVDIGQCITLSYGRKPAEISFQVAREKGK